MKVAFLDRDGTIVKDYTDIEWRDVDTPEFLDGSIEGIHKLIDLGYEIIIITNQYLINDGIISIQEYKRFTEKMMGRFSEEKIRILDIFYCPHSKKETCKCYKPASGLIEAAMQKYPEIDISYSIMIGDSICDMELAEHFKMIFYGIIGGNLSKEDGLYKTINHVAEII